MNNNMLPTQFLSRLQNIVPQHTFLDILNHFSQPRPTTFRVNTLKTDTVSLKNNLDSLHIPNITIDYIPNTFSTPCDSHDLLVKSHLFNEGQLYVQDLASMLAPIVLAPEINESILDLTAAPGSKTTQIAAMLNNQAHIAAVEKSRPRFFKLKNNLAQQGVTSAKLYLKDGAQVWRHCGNHFDRVLLDAPCSTEARFSTLNPNSYRYWSLKKVKAMASKQWPLLRSAFLCLKPHGTLVYATCSFSPEENEAIINKLLEKYPNQAKIEQIDLPINNIQPGLTQFNNRDFHPAIQQCVRILPNKMMSGFFICKIRKIGSTE